MFQLQGKPAVPPYEVPAIIARTSGSIEGGRGQLANLVKHNQTAPIVRRT